ncbi:hypothetical protein GGX14DRAFT_389093 [Mycena pura]|uniref:Uncharacterized protein n=1 Tax=Mycena pura TaxID=153505 RepID=A0AAD6YK13_9AGAR|nr:hypothetical protein GGX14DRAFT_389093 [Mycena pura]
MPQTCGCRGFASCLRRVAVVDLRTDRRRTARVRRELAGVRQSREWWYRFDVLPFPSRLTSSAWFIEIQAARRVSGEAEAWKSRKWIRSHWHVTTPPLSQRRRKHQWHPASARGPRPTCASVCGAICRLPNERTRPPPEPRTRLCQKRCSTGHPHVGTELEVASASDHRSQVQVERRRSPEASAIRDRCSTWRQLPAATLLQLQRAPLSNGGTVASHATELRRRLASSVMSRSTIYELTLFTSIQLCMLGVIRLARMPASVRSRWRRSVSCTLQPSHLPVPSRPYQPTFSPHSALARTLSGSVLSGVQRDGVTSLSSVVASQRRYPNRRSGVRQLGSRQLDVPLCAQVFNTLPYTGGPIRKSGTAKKRCGTLACGASPDLRGDWPVNPTTFPLSIPRAHRSPCCALRRLTRQAEHLPPGAYMSITKSSVANQLVRVHPRADFICALQTLLEGRIYVLASEMRSASCGSTSFRHSRLHILCVVPEKVLSRRRSAAAFPSARLTRCLLCGHKHYMMQLGASPYTTALALLHLHLHACTPQLSVCQRPPVAGTGTTVRIRHEAQYHPRTTARRRRAQGGSVWAQSGGRLIRLRFTLLLITHYNTQANLLSFDLDDISLPLHLVNKPRLEGRRALLALHLHLPRAASSCCTVAQQLRLRERELLFQSPHYSRTLVASCTVATASEHHATSVTELLIPMSASCCLETLPRNARIRSFVDRDNKHAPCPFTCAHLCTRPFVRVPSRLRMPRYTNVSVEQAHGRFLQAKTGGLSGRQYTSAAATTYDGRRRCVSTDCRLAPTHACVPVAEQLLPGTYKFTTKQDVADLRLYAGFVQCQVALQHTWALWYWSDLGRDHGVVEHLARLHSAPSLGNRRYRPGSWIFIRRRAAHSRSEERLTRLHLVPLVTEYSNNEMNLFSFYLESIMHACEEDNQARAGRPWSTRCPCLHCAALSRCIVTRGLPKPRCAEQVLSGLQTPKFFPTYRVTAGGLWGVERSKTMTQHGIVTYREDRDASSTPGPQHAHSEQARQVCVQACPSGANMSHGLIMRWTRRRRTQVKSQCVHRSRRYTSSREFALQTKRVRADMSQIARPPARSRMGQYQPIRATLRMPNCVVLKSTVSCNEAKPHTTAWPPHEHGIARRLPLKEGYDSEGVISCRRTRGSTTTAIPRCPRRSETRVDKEASARTSVAQFHPTRFVHAAANLGIPLKSCHCDGTRAANVGLPKGLWVGRRGPPSWGAAKRSPLLTMCLLASARSGESHICRRTRAVLGRQREGRRVVPARRDLAQCPRYVAAADLQNGRRGTVQATRTELAWGEGEGGQRRRHKQHRRIPRSRRLKSEDRSHVTTPLLLQHRQCTSNVTACVLAASQRVPRPLPNYLSNPPSPDADHRTRAYIGASRALIMQIWLPVASLRRSWPSRPSTLRAVLVVNCPPIYAAAVCVPRRCPAGSTPETPPQAATKSGRIRELLTTPTRHRHLTTTSYTASCRPTAACSRSRVQALCARRATRARRCVSSRAVARRRMVHHYYIPRYSKVCHVMLRCVSLGRASWFRKPRRAIGHCSSGGAIPLALLGVPPPLAFPRRYLARHFAAFVQQAVAERGAPSGAAPRSILAVHYIVDRVERLGGISHHMVLRPSFIHPLLPVHTPCCRTARIWRGP